MTRSSSSPAIRLALMVPQRVHLCRTAVSPSARIQMLMGSIVPRQRLRRSPTVKSTCRLWRHLGQWFLCLVPYSGGGTEVPQWAHVKDGPSMQDHSVVSPASSLSLVPPERRFLLAPPVRYSYCFLSISIFHALCSFREIVYRRFFLRAR